MLVAVAGRSPVDRINQDAYVRCLVVTHGPPLPATRGARIRDLELVTRLSEIEHVDLLVLLEHGDQRDALAPLAAKVGRLETVVAGGTGPVAGFRAPGLLGSGVPLASLPYLSRAARSRFAALVTELKPDLVQIEHSFLAPLTDSLPSGSRPATVLSLHNVGDSQYGSMASAARGPARAAFRLKRSLIARLERRYLPLFDLVVCVSAVDALRVSRMAPGVDTAVVPNAVDLARLKPLGAAGFDQGILFVGAMDYRPNADGARWLCTEVLPILRRDHPEAKVRLVGAIPAALATRLRGLAGVEVTGPVAEQGGMLQGAEHRLAVDAAAAVIRRRRPVVSTELGCEGIDSAHGEELEIAEGAEGFAVAISHLLADPSRRAERSRRARRLVEDRYSWDAAAAQLADAHRRVLA